MRDTQIREWVQSLFASFGEPKRLANPEPLRRLHAEKRYTEMVGLISDYLRLDLQIRVGFVNSGGPKEAPAWVRGIGPVPMFGTSAFKQHTVEVFFRKSFLAEATFGITVIAIAHELSHVVLDAVRHTHRKQEEVVDLTAMFLGYRKFYLGDAHTTMSQVVDDYELLMKFVRQTVPEMAKVFASIGEECARSAGYLSKEEVRYAAALMRT